MSSRISYKKLLEWERGPVPRLPRVVEWLINKNDFSCKPEHDFLWVSLVILSARILRNNLILQHYWITAKKIQADTILETCTG